MVANRSQTKLVAIVGPTASGKSGLAMKLAREFNGEIVCADSQTLYKGMDIGTAKPSEKDRAAIPHHLLDIVEPDVSFSVADFKKQAERAIRQIQSRNSLAILVGGSGLYVDSVLFNFKFAPLGDAKTRAKLEAMTSPELVKYAEQNSVPLGGIGKNNKRHLVRAIERGGVVEQRLQLRRGALVIGIMPPPSLLRRRVSARAKKMIKDGVVEEADRLSAEYGWDRLDGVIYGLIRDYRENDQTLEELREEFIRKDLALAKRQKTWFKRDPHINWFSDPAPAYDFAKTRLLNN